MKHGNTILLLTPPPIDPTQCYTSLPALTAFLRERGYRVVQRDLGLELFDEILSVECLKKSREKAITRAESEARSGTVRLGEGYLDCYSRMIGLSEYLIKNVSRAKALMKEHEGFYDLKLYQWATNVLNLCCTLASLPYYPTKVMPSNYYSSIDFTFAGLLKETEDHKTNFYHHLFETQVVPDLLALDPYLIGISITYKFQVVPGFTLARLLKKAAPKVHLTVGGATLSRMDSHLIHNPGFFEFADSFVIGEGETALHSLAKAIKGGNQPHGIPNCIINENGKPQTLELGYLEDINGLPCPDYNGLDLKRYFSPEPVLLLSTTRGCYHGKCAFCDVSRNTRSKYRPLTSDKMLKNIFTLYKKYGAKQFIFTDDAMPPAHMRQVARLVKRELHDLTWQAEARFEKTLSDDFLNELKDGGCRQLIFGFESSNQRILNMMGKRNSVETDVKILDSCHRQGIAVNLQTISGFPTETQEEALGTIDFLLDNERWIAAVGFANFSLYEGTPVYKNSAEYSVSNFRHSLSDSLLSPCLYEPLLGMSIEDAKKIYTEGLDRLLQTYATRTRYLAGASGAHSLLHFTRYQYAEIYDLWTALDAPARRTLKSLPDIVPTLSPSIRFFSCMKQYPGAPFIAFCVETGTCYDLSENEKSIMDLCDGKRSVGEIASLWTKMRKVELDQEILFLGRGMTGLHQLLHNGLLIAASN